MQKSLRLKERGLEGLKDLSAQYGVTFYDFDASVRDPESAPDNYWRIAADWRCRESRRSDVPKTQPVPQAKPWRDRQIQAVENPHQRADKFGRVLVHDLDRDVS